MSLESELSLRVVLGFDCFQIGVQRRLDVHDEMSLVRHLDDHVRTNDLSVRHGVRLFDEVAMFHHAGQFHEAAQRDFAPPTAYFGSPQRLDEVLRFLRQRLLAVLHFLELVLDAAIGFAAGLFQFGDLPL